MAAKPLPETVYLRECFDYNPETGVLTWKHRPREHFKSERAWRAFSQFTGKAAGGSTDRYVRLVLDNAHHFYAHRAIWAMQTGEWPTAEIDHKNGNKTDNRWVNLRLASRHENMRNRPGWSGRSLPKGVIRSRNHYAARGNVDGKSVYLGVFDTPEQAHEAYKAFSSARHGEFFDPGKAQECPG